MAHIRDIRPSALEIKFLLDPAIAAGVASWARANLAPDPNGGGAWGDEYQTTSLYFDNASYDVFNRRGSFGRSKYRIRRYGEESSAFLERKMRQPAVLAKRRTRLSCDDLEQLSAATVDPEWPGYWFHRRVAARQLRPVCQVSYARMARGATSDGHAIRLTLDHDLRVRPAAGHEFESGDGIAAAPDVYILELKYQGTSPALFRRLAEEFALTAQPASKYRMGLAALGKTAPVLTVPGESVQASYA
jgi:hypothetical protein